MDSSAARAMTPNAYANRLGVGIHKVLLWIKRGELVAVNVSESQHRPQWKILPEAVAQFEARRASQPGTELNKRARKLKNANAIEFF